MARLTHGVLVVDKPKGLTSHAVVAQARRYYDQKAVGHAGTLDPMATGVLLLLLGEATKLSSYLTAEFKRYLASVKLGAATDTLDATGTVTQRATDPCLPKAAELQAALVRERARALQKPPDVSAIKLSGRRAYERARRGETLDPAERPVTVRELRLLADRRDELDFELVVSKGYYVRSFARDFGQHLGVPAHLSALRRIESGRFSIAEACSWPPTLRPTPISVEAAAVRCLKTETLTEEGVARAQVGKRLRFRDLAGQHDPNPSSIAGDEVVALVSESGQMIALGRREQLAETGDAPQNARSAAFEYRVVRGFRRADSANE